MSMPDLFLMRSDDDGIHLGVIYSTSPKTLRVFGSAYMQGPDAKGALKILNPNGSLHATYDYWENKWIFSADADA